MQINVSQQLKAPTGTAREYDVKELIDILEVGNPNPVTGSIKFTRTHRGILVQGKLNVVLPGECSRCLKTFECSLNFDIEEEYFPLIDVNSGSHIELPEDPASFTIDEHHILDLTEAIRQNALLAVPMKPLCRDDCAGFCVSCGADLNVKTCDCSRSDNDSLWTKLVNPDSNTKNEIKSKNGVKNGPLNQKKIR